MKKIALASVLAVAAIAASATELAVTGIRDTTQNAVTGYGISVAQPVTKALTVKAGFENTAGVVGTNVDTYKLDASYDVTTFGPITLTGIGGVGYTDVQAGSLKGSFVKFGAQASAAVPYVNGLSTSLAVTRQLGTSAVTALDHTEATVGLRYQATKAISVNGSATFYDNVAGSKMGLGVAYAF